MGGIKFDDLQWKKRYSPTQAYAQSKSANLMFALELDRRSKRAGWGIVSNAAHPGFTKTNLQLSGPSQGKESRTLWERFYRLSRQVMPFMWQEIDEGILPALYAATSPEAQGGAFYGPRGVYELAGGGVKDAKVPAHATSDADRPPAVGGLRAVDRGELPNGRLNPRLSRRSPRRGATVVMCPNPASSCARSRWTAVPIPQPRGCRRPDC